MFSANIAKFGKIGDALIGDIICKLGKKLQNYHPSQTYI